MLPVIGWRVWHSDGVVYSSASHRWWDIPRVGVQVVCFYHQKPYRTFEFGRDDYRMPGQRWVKRGSWMREADFYALIAAAEAEDSWP